MKMELYEQCKNCRNFIQHYVTDGCHLLAIHEGHCTHGFERGFRMTTDCESFEDCEQIAAERVAWLLKQLQETENNINVIKHLLKKYGDVLVRQQEAALCRDIKSPAEPT